MSDNRKILIAKRKDDRGKCTNLPQNIQRNQDNNSRRGAKRPNDTPKKNLANDRLKRLRTSLNKEIQKSEEKSKNVPISSVNNKSGKPNKCSKNVRKRLQNDPPQEPVAIKIPKQATRSEEVGFAFRKEHSTQKKSFTSVMSTSSESTITKVQKISNENVEDMEWSTTDDPLDCSTSTSQSNKVICDKNTKNQFFIVVDTNIFLSHLHIIKDIINIKITGNITPVIFIPWIVIEELDFIKEDSNKTNLKFKAREAIKYVEHILSSKHSRMRGQSLDEVNEQKNIGKSQDDKIIACSLQVLEKYQNMILLTNDINLKNKGHFNSIPVCSHDEIMKKVSLLNQSKAQVIMNRMTSLCSDIINECAKSAYGLACSKMPICQLPRKSLQDCLSIFTKYWFPVFQEFLMHQFKKSIDDLSAFLAKNERIENDSNELNDLLRLCVRVCLFLKDVEFCRPSIENTIRDLNSIKEL